MEQPVRDGLQRRRQVGAGQQNLGARSLELGDHSLLMRLIQFGSQIVKADDRPLAAVTREERCLRQEAGQSRELFLATRQMLA